MEFDDHLVLLFGEVPALEVRPEVINPAETTALAAAEEPCGLGEGPPAAFAVGSNVSDQLIILLFGPCTFVGVSLLTTRRPPHQSFPLHTYS